MKNLVKILSAFVVVMISIITLASCDSYSFYEDWYQAGATVLEEDNVFKVVSLDEVKTMKEASESFMVFLGRSSDSKAVSEVNQIQFDADNMNYEGKIYFLNTGDYVETISGQKKINDTLGIKFEDSTSGIVVVCYEEGNVKFETTRPDNYAELELLKIEGVLTIQSLAYYAFTYYPAN